MRRFLVRTVIFIGGLALLLNGIGALADHLQPQDKWQALAEQDYTVFLQRSHELAAVAIGNSHVSAIDFTTLGIDGELLIRAGSDLFELHKYVQHVVRKAPNLEVALIAVSYFSFDQDNAVSNDSRILRINLYAMLPTWLPERNDFKNLLLGKLQKATRIMDVARPDSWRNVVYSAFTTPDAAAGGVAGEQSFVDQAAHSPAHDGQCPYLDRQDLAKVSVGRVQSQVASVQQESNAHQALRVDALAALAATIELLQAEGVRVVLFTPPYSEPYNTSFRAQAPGLIDGMYRSVQLLQKQYQVAYYDFSDYPALTTHDEYFADSDHLNLCGRRAFSEHLKNAMLSVGTENVVHNANH